MKMKTIMVGALVLALAVGGVAWAGPGGGGGFFGGRMMRVLHDLQLTDQQEDLAFDIGHDIKKRARQMRKDAAGSLGTVSAELAKPKPDAAKLHAVADQRIEEMKKLAHYAIDRFLALHATLSADQRQELVKRLDKIDERRRRYSDDD
jgi:Spy/CpxP family protein refolding chaperone